MAVSVKKIMLWRGEVDDKPGALARALAPLAAAGSNLRLVMGYRLGGTAGRAAVELHPVASKKVTAAASTAGLAPVSTPALLVEGDDRPGLGHAIAQAIADAGIDLGYVVAQVAGKRYSAVIGFSADADADKAVGLIKQAAAAKKPAAKKSAAKKPARKKAAAKSKKR